TGRDRLLWVQLCLWGHGAPQSDALHAPLCGSRDATLSCVGGTLLDLLWRCLGGFCRACGRVADVPFATLHGMLRPPAERERERIMPGLCSHCHTDQGMKDGNTTVHICNTPPRTASRSPVVYYGPSISPHRLSLKDTP